MGLSVDVDRPAGLVDLAMHGPVATILWGTALSSRDVTFWIASEGDWLNGYTTESWSAYERARLLSALDELSQVAAVTFAEVSERHDADFVIGLDTDEMPSTLLGFFFPPEIPGAGMGLFNASAWDRAAGGDLEDGGFGYATMTHELLHGLGLAHPHDHGGASSIMAGVEVAYRDGGDFGLNQGVYTTMSYNRGLLAADVGAPATMSGAWGIQIGPMALDIAALQYLYGANMTTATGDDVYELPRLNTIGTGWRTIWDAGGTDTIRYDGTRDAVIDLRAATLTEADGGGGFLSAATGIAGGFTIAYGVVIENAETGEGNDLLRGNAADNSLSGFRGDDTLIGAAGNDRLTGQRGADQIEGGDGDDWISAGRDADDVDGGAGDDVILAGQGDDHVLGGAGNDTILGRKGYDIVDGGDGEDTLNGGPGQDQVAGGRGDDVITLGYGKDTFVFALGDGHDRVTDFLVGRDRLRLDAALFDDPATVNLIHLADETEDGLRIGFEGGDQITLTGVTLASLPDLGVEVGIGFV